MAISSISCSFEEDREIWHSLKEVIADSSGFQRWQEETNLDAESEEASLEEQVRGYLRSTLETLAY
jgi:hypothetical protein